MASQCAHRDTFTGNVGDRRLRGAVAVRQQESGALLDGRMAFDGGLDLAQFHAVAVDLHLVIDSARDMDRSVRGNPSEIPGAIGTAVLGGIDEPACLVSSTQVAGSRPGSGEDEFARIPGIRTWGQYFGATEGPTDRSEGVRGQSVIGAPDGGLGRSVEIANGPEPGYKARSETWIQRLSPTPHFEVRRQ